MYVGLHITRNRSQRLLTLDQNTYIARVLKRFEIENYLFDPELLAAYCQARGRTLDDASYKAIVKDIVNDNVKDQTNAVKDACGVAANYSNEKFKLELATVVRSDMSIYAELVACIFGRK